MRQCTVNKRNLHKILFCVFYSFFYSLRNFICLAVTNPNCTIAITDNNESSNNDVLLLIDGRSAYLDFFGVIVWDAL